MAPLDLSTSLPDLDVAEPAGPNLELDQAFGALERAALGTPERQAGDKILPAEDPVWKDVAAQATELLDRTYDLRVFVHLAVARLHISGLYDFAGVLGTIAGLLATRWDHVHPQLDPEDDNDPTLRANALLQLAHPLRVVRLLRTMPLAASQRAGAVSWRTIGIASGAVESTDPEEKRTGKEIEAAFADTSADKIDALREGITAALSAITLIGSAFDTNSGYGNGPLLEPLVKQLQEMARYIEIYAIKREVLDIDAGTSAEVEAPSAGSPDVVVSRGGVSASALTAISTRTDALRLLDLVCRYYEQYEPSSPLPLLIGRARKLADKGFLEILQDLAPDGISQAQAVVQSRDHDLQA